MTENSDQAALRARASAIQSEIGEASWLCGDLEAKIDRLVGARSRMREYLDTYSATVVGKPAASAYHGEWKGQLRDRWDDLVRNGLENELLVYQDRLCELIADMSNQITTLEAQLTQAQQLSNQLKSSLFDLEMTMAKSTSGSGW